MVEKMSAVEDVPPVIPATAGAVCSNIIAAQAKIDVV
jgi:hypothetical protein